MRTQLTSIARDRFGNASNSDRKALWFEICSYVFFLALFVWWTTFAYGNLESYRVLEATRAETIERVFTTPDGQQITFHRIASTSTMYYWLKNVLFDVIIKDEFDNGQPAPLIEQNYVTGANKIFGRIRFRLIRVQRDEGCFVDPTYQQNIRHCYPDIENGEEETKPFGPNNAWVHTSTDQNGEITWLGKYSLYPGSGYVIDVPLNKTDIEKTLEMMKQHHFIDQSARVLLIDFNLFNPAHQLHVACRVAFEFGAVGGVRSFAVFSALNLFRYQGPLASQFIAAELALLLFIIFFIASAARAMYHLGPKVFFGCKPLNPKIAIHMQFKMRASSWEILDLFNNLLFVILVFTRIGAFIEERDVMPQTEDNSKFIPLSPLNIVFTMERFVSGANGFLLWVKLFKYISFVPRVTFVQLMFQHAMIDIIFFFLVFLIFIIGLGHMSYLWFMTDMYKFRTFSISLMTLFKAMIGGLRTTGMEESNRTLAPIFIIIFDLFVVLLCLNVFIAILNDAYKMTNKELHTQGLDAVNAMKRLRSMIASNKRWLVESCCGGLQWYFASHHLSRLRIGPVGGDDVDSNYTRPYDYEIERPKPEESKEEKKSEGNSDGVQTQAKDETSKVDESKSKLTIDTSTSSSTKPEELPNWTANELYTEPPAASSSSSSSSSLTVPQLRINLSPNATPATVAFDQRHALHKLDTFTRRFTQRVDAAQSSFGSQLDRLKSTIIERFGVPQ